MIVLIPLATLAAAVWICTKGLDHVAVRNGDSGTRPSQLIGRYRKQITGCLLMASVLSILVGR